MATRSGNPGTRPRGRPRGRPRNSDAQLTRETILSGAAQAFSKRGFSATSMREVAEKTSASLGAIYYHFPSKESILEEIICGNFERVAAAARLAIAEIEDPRTRLHVFIRNHISFFSLHLDEMRVMAHELDSLGGDAGKRVVSLRRDYTGIARVIIRELRPELNRSELQVAVLSLFGMLNWTYRWWNTLPRGTRPEDVAEQMSSLYLEGLLPRS
jgi:AcrR family transcriptional regulator